MTDKKLIMILMILSILVIGCSNYESRATTQPTQSPAIGGGCGVSTQNTEQTEGYAIKKIPIAGAF